MYNSMWDGVARVEASIEDVKELLQKRKGDTWEEEWEAVVQELLQRDSGWK